MIYTSPPAIVRSVGRARHVDLVVDNNTHKMFTNNLKYVETKCMIKVEMKVGH